MPFLLKLSCLLLSAISLAAIADCLPVRYGGDPVALYGRDSFEPLSVRDVAHLQRRSDAGSDDSMSGLATQLDHDAHIHHEITRRIQGALHSGGDHTKNTHHIKGKIDVSDLPGVQRHHVEWAAKQAYDHTMNKANPTHASHVPAANDPNWHATVNHVSEHGRNHLMSAFHTDGHIHLSSIRRNTAAGDSIHNQAPMHTPTLHAARQQPGLAQGHKLHHAEDGAYAGFEKNARKHHPDGPHSPGANAAVQHGYQHGDMAVYGHRQHQGNATPQLHAGCPQCSAMANVLHVNHPNTVHGHQPRGPI